MNGTFTIYGYKNIAKQLNMSINMNRILCMRKWLFLVSVWVVKKQRLMSKTGPIMANEETYEEPQRLNLTIFVFSLRHVDNEGLFLPDEFVRTT